MGGLPMGGLDGLFAPPYVLPTSLQAPPGQLPSTAAFIGEQIVWLQQQLQLLHPDALTAAAAATAAATATAAAATAAQHVPAPTPPQRSASACCSASCSS